MKSIASSLVEGFDLKPDFRPAALEDILVGLIATLARHDLLGTAVGDIERNTDIVFAGNLSAIREISSNDNIPYLYKYPKAISLLLNLLPIIGVIAEHEIVDIPNGVLTGSNSRARRRSLIRNVDILNGMDMGFKLYPLVKSPELIGVISYTDHDDLLRILPTLGLTMTEQDRILQ